MTVGMMCATKAAELGIDDHHIERLTGIHRKRVYVFLNHDLGLSFPEVCLVLMLLGVDPGEAVRCEVSRWKFKAVTDMRSGKARTLRYHSHGIQGSVALAAGLRRHPAPPDGGPPSTRADRRKSTKFAIKQQQQGRQESEEAGSGDRPDNQG